MAALGHLDEDDAGRDLLHQIGIAACGLGRGHLRQHGRGGGRRDGGGEGDGGDLAARRGFGRGLGGGLHLWKLLLLAHHSGAPLGSGAPFGCNEIWSPFLAPPSQFDYKSAMERRSLCNAP
ncbi:hypothetical protein FGG78_34810 [Thioclava sp. BHET1]|nr:hypothetical protein FGG78_34810 [Thioclava sp. BHET1]